MSSKALMDRVFSRIKHGDDAHRAWLKEELDKMAEDIEKDWLVLDPVQLALMRSGIKTYLDYAGSYITVQKLRSGELGLSPEEKEISPGIVQALALLGIHSEAKK